jgi:exodeoxyribonuclease VII large subunit
VGLTRAIEKQLSGRRNTLTVLEAGLGDPRRKLTQERLRLTDASERAARRVRRTLRAGAEGLRELTARLQRVRPQAQLRARQVELADVKARLEAVARRDLVGRRASLGKLSVGLERGSPRPALRQARAALAVTARTLPGLVGRRVSGDRRQLAQLAATLHAMSPLGVLGRGYAIARRPDGRVVRSADDAARGDALTLTVGGGDQLEVAVTQVKPGPK